MPTRRRPLPLHALPAFVAATRHGSFRGAAAELRLTPSAISHQMRVLEEAVGVALFERLPRGLRLTEAGRAFANTVSEVLARLETEAAALSEKLEERRLLVSLPDFVAHVYALPALSRFHARHPEIGLEIQATMSLADVEAGGADAAVRIGTGQWGKLHARLITPLAGTLVATPELASQAEDLAKRGELPMVCLKQLEDHTRRTLAAAGLVTRASRTLCLDSYMGVVQAAKEGLGVAVVYAPPNRPHELGPRLVTLPSEPIEAPFAMYFVCRPSDAERPELLALREWLAECILGG